MFGRRAMPADSSTFKSGILFSFSSSAVAPASPPTIVFVWQVNWPVIEGDGIPCGTSQAAWSIALGAVQHSMDWSDWIFSIEHWWSTAVMPELDKVNSTTNTRPGVNVCLAKNFILATSTTTVPFGKFPDFHVIGPDSSKILETDPMGPQNWELFAIDGAFSPPHPSIT